MFARCRHFNMQNAYCPHCLLSDVSLYTCQLYVVAYLDIIVIVLHMCVHCIVPCRDVNQA